MKSLLAVGLIFLSANALALECGPRVSTDKLDQLQGTVSSAGALLNQHTESIVKDMSERLRTARSEAAYAQFDKLNLEVGQIQNAESRGGEVESALRIAIAVAQVRDVMLDRRDVVRANTLLSHHIYAVRRVAERANPRVNETLTKISIPGVAFDAVKLRDAIAALAKEFERCESPGSKK